MLTHWNKLINTDCVVVGIGDQKIYPIFRNGSSSLINSANKKYVNNKIKKLDNIIILLRDPEYRFVSGLNEYCRQNKLDIEWAWQEAHDNRLVDRHFAPQWIWLFHLYKYYKGSVTLKPFASIKKYCQVQKHRTKTRKYVSLLKHFVEIDYALMEHLNETISLETLVRKYKKHVLS
tara:strand:+ start:1832 stop:2359 length:528 start_codon:yes stop_codon:yes gene_type:complete